tara:strand:+ start:14139 stop:14804 length:666 start_codon:yes stop_codon:yes gene_type:complete
MDPITLAILGSVAGSAIGALPSIIPSKFEREQKKRLEALQRKEEMGTLGLTDKEQSVLEGRLETKADSAEEFAQSERERLLATQSGGATAGAKLLGAQVASEMEREQNRAIDQSVAEQDLAKQQRQIDEIRALEAAQGQYAANRTQAIAGVVGSGVEAGFSSAAQQKIIQGNMTPSSNSVNAIAQLYGITDDQARGLLEVSAKNPEALRLYQTLNTPSSGQ